MHIGKQQVCKGQVPTKGVHRWQSPSNIPCTTIILVIPTWVGQRRRDRHHCGGHSSHRGYQVRYWWWPKCKTRELRIGGQPVRLQLRWCAMKLHGYTSGVEGVGSSCKGNTSTKGRLEFLSIYMKRKQSLHGYFQIYTILPTYIYESTPMTKD